MRISKKRFKAVLCAILSMCIFAYSAYPVFAEEQAAQEASTEQTQATTIDPNDLRTEDRNFRLRAINISKFLKKQKKILQIRKNMLMRL